MCILHDVCLESIGRVILGEKSANTQLLTTVLPKCLGRWRRLNDYWALSISSSCTLSKIRPNTDWEMSVVCPKQAHILQQQNLTVSLFFRHYLRDLVNHRKSPWCWNHILFVDNTLSNGTTWSWKESILIDIRENTSTSADNLLYFILLLVIPRNIFKWKSCAHTF